MAEPLNLHSVIGFGGGIETGSLLLHPDGKTLIYALGSTIVLRDKTDPRSQEFLQGHTDKVSCFALSRSGRYLASGQVTFMGFTADIIVWDLETRTLLHRMGLHKVKIQALDFSADEKFLASLGGQDDNNLVLWDVASGAAVCGSPTHYNFTLSVKFFNNRNDALVTGGAHNLKVWHYDRAHNHLNCADVQLGHLRRVVNCVTIDANDQWAYCGTTTGDVLQINLERMLMRNTGPAKAPIQMGVTASCEAPTGDMLIGGGDGTLALMATTAEADPKHPKQSKKLAVLASTKLDGGITGMVLESVAAKSFTLLVGTNASNILRVTYSLATNKFSHELVQTAHADKIAAITFPDGLSDIFATCSTGNIRVWHLPTCRELLRIAVPNLEAKCVAFAPDGKSIVSGWSDGKVRAFGPQTGKLLYTINDAHHKAVTAVAMTSDSSRLISGGEEGFVRVWRITKQSQVMEASMKDHKGPVNSINMKPSSDDECVSASNDGSCIIWDLTTFKRHASLFGNTLFKSAKYHPDGSQIITAGTDRKVTYWDAYDGKEIRVVDGSDSDPVTALAVDKRGEIIVSGADDKMLKFWSYDAGISYATGVAHTGTITDVAVTPDCTKIVSVGSEGGIFIWECPPTPTVNF